MSCKFDSDAVRRAERLSNEMIRVARDGLETHAIQIHNDFAVEVSCSFPVLI